MPRLRRAKNKAVIASGRLLSVGGKNGQRYHARQENWQEIAWQFYDTIPEYHQAVTWISNIVSRAVLRAVNEQGDEVTDPVVQDALAELYGGPDYQPEMLRLLGIHLTVAGDCYLGAIQESVLHKVKWGIYTPMDIQARGDNWVVCGKEYPAETVSLIRIWRPHPRKPKMADSPTRAVLAVLSEIDGLTKHVNAQIDSRLAGNGILFVPDDIDFSTQQTQTDDAGDEVTNTPDGVQGFADELVETMDMAIKDPSSASAMSPMVAQVSGDSIKNIKHVTFWTPLQQAAQSMRDAAVHRLALGMDMPPEALTGTGDMNHWGAWAIDEAAIKIHAIPFLTVVTSSLTAGYLTPVLEADGYADVDQVLFDADTTELRLRPNRSQEAKDLWDRGALSDQMLRQETGFDESAAPDTDNFNSWLARKMILSSSATPEMQHRMLQVLGFPVGDVDKDGSVTTRITEQERIQEPKGAKISYPGTSDRPVQPGPPEQKQPADAQPDAGDAAAAAAVLVFRALERAGNKLRNSRAVLRATEGVPANRVYLSAEYLPEQIGALLDGAWDQLAELELSVPPQKLAKWLQAYTVRLLTEKIPYTPESVGAFIRSEMALAGLDAAE